MAPRAPQVTLSQLPDNSPQLPDHSPRGCDRHSGSAPALGRWCSDSGRLGRPVGRAHWPMREGGLALRRGQHEGGWQAGLTILGPHWVPASTVPKSGRSGPAPDSMKTPLQVTSRLPSWTVESTDTVYGASGFCWPPWHCSFPHRASLGTKERVVKQREMPPNLPRLCPLCSSPTSGRKARRPGCQGHSSRGYPPRSSPPGSRLPGPGGSLGKLELV